MFEKNIDFTNHKAALSSDSPQVYFFVIATSRQHLVGLVAHRQAVDICLVGNEFLCKVVLYRY